MSSTLHKCIRLCALVQRMSGPTNLFIARVQHVSSLTNLFGPHMQNVIDPINLSSDSRVTLT